MRPFGDHRRRWLVVCVGCENSATNRRRGRPFRFAVDRPAARRQGAFTCCKLGKIQRWKALDLTAIGPSMEFPGSIRALAAAPQGRLLAVEPGGLWVPARIGNGPLCALALPKSNSEALFDKVQPTSLAPGVARNRVDVATNPQVRAEAKPPAGR